MKTSVNWGVRSAHALAATRAHAVARSSHALIAMCVLALASVPSAAHAESGRLNLHVDVGAGLPVASYLAPPGKNDYTAHWGIAGWLSIDYVVAGPFALEVIGGGGRFFETISVNNANGGMTNPSGFTMGMVAAGFRLRFLDHPYGGDPNKRPANLWLSGHLGYQKFAGSQFGLDGAIGYEWALSRPVSLGLFLRGLVAFNGDLPAFLGGGSHFTAALFMGVNGSFELVGRHREAAPTPTTPQAEPVPEPTPTDNDGDGILNEVDQCPEIVEDRDGYQDEDGCPDPDNDHDRVLDVDDRCPMDPEDMDGFEDQDGCPDLDNDHDGVADLDDRCPVQAGPAENNGCPDSDRDGDTVVDRIDNCPDEPGTVENHGCAQQQLVVIQGDHLEILEKVYFRLNAATIDRRSYPLLMNVAAVLNAHPEIQKIRIEGHTDARGNAQRNVQLSQRRAAAVMNFLKTRGHVARARLSAQGFGPNQPIYPNATTEAEHEANRRVEFRIVQP